MSDSTELAEVSSLLIAPDFLRVTCQNLHHLRQPSVSVEMDGRLVSAEREGIEREKESK